LFVPEEERENVINYLNQQVQHHLDNPSSLDPAQSAFITTVLMGM
jgi:hypothetical protein